MLDNFNLFYTSCKIRDLATRRAEKAGLKTRDGALCFRRPALEGSIPFNAIVPVFHVHYVVYTIVYRYMCDIWDKAD